MRRKMSLLGWCLRRSLSLRKAATITMTLMGLSLGGCVSPAKITWSADARSPDGQWVAVAHTEEISGFGTGAVGTFVDLKPINGDSVEVLAFDDGGQDLAL